MPDLSHRQLALYLVAGALVVLIGAKWVMAGGHAAQGAAPPANTFNAGSSARAGGSGGGVSVTGTDGQAVVDVTGEVRRPGVYRMAAGARVEAAVTRAGGATAHAELGAVNLAAKVQDGQQVVVPRRGPGGAAVAATAQKILDYRQQHGGFASVDDLDQVPGIGPKKLAALRPHVTA